MSLAAVTVGDLVWFGLASSQTPGLALDGLITDVIQGLNFSEKYTRID